jgi:dTDP-4-dehydrorhamnose 3,5-epimerase-like enzyme
MACPDSKISIVANTWVKQMHFVKAGDINEGHKHTFSHQTLLAKGSVKVSVNDKETVFVAPHIIFIGGGYEHGMVALEDDTIVYCIHALRDGEDVGNIIDPADIPAGVTPLIEIQGKELLPTDML